ncbi:MAG: NAD(P)-binding domain-containing protein, partial [Ignavibacteriaceae bacterium]
MSIISKYFNWLQKDNPIGEVERYPELDAKGETSVKGIYIIGDLTGIPLLKLASESGKKIINQFKEDSEFQKLRSQNNDNNIYDIIIIGAGISGIAAGMEAIKNDFKFKILESAERFTTIINFPKNKPIYAEPGELKQESDLIINDGTKESLIEELQEQTKNIDLPIDEGIMVDKIEKKNNHFELTTKKQNYKALRIILAIGKSGNARILKVPGEDKPKVFNRLFDPADAKGEEVLVVGGGDSAMETAIATAEYAKSVTISYRKKEFSRPKEGNVIKLDKLVSSGKIKLLMETEVKEIKDSSVIITSKDAKETEIKNSMIFTMIGRELPTDFFKRSNIKMEGELSTTAKLQFLLLILISCIIYFGKTSADFINHFLQLKVGSFADAISQFINLSFWGKFLSLPLDIFSTLFSDQTRVWNVTKYINAGVAYVAFIASLIIGIYLLIKFLRDNYKTFSFNWKTFKYAYFIFMGAFFLLVFFGGRYFGLEVFGKPQTFWYTGFYSLTILVFGLQRIKRKPTKY